MYKKLLLLLISGLSFVLIVIGILSYRSSQVGLAPESMKGKTISFYYVDSERRTNNGDTSKDIETAPWERINTYISDDFITFQTKTKSIRKYAWGIEAIKNGRICVVTADYAKLSDNTAEIKEEKDNFCDGIYRSFVLTFLLPNYGTVTWEEYYGDYLEEGRGAVFYID